LPPPLASVDAAAAAELAAAAATPDDDLAAFLAAFQGADVAPRAAALCLAHRLSADKQGAPAERLLAGVMARVATPEMQSNAYFRGSLAHRRKVRAWQALSVLAPAAREEAVAQQLLAAALDALGRAELASVRQYQESVLYVLLAPRPAAARAALLPLLRDYAGKGDAVPSALMAAANVALALGRDDAAAGAAFARELLVAALPWGLHHHHATRSYALLVTAALLDAFPLSDDALWGGSDARPFLAAVQAFTEQSPGIASFRAAVGALLEPQPAALCHPARVLTTGAALVATAEAPLEGAPPSLMARIEACLAGQRAEKRVVDCPWANVIAQEAGTADAPAAAGHQRKIEPCGPVAAEDWLGKALGLPFALQSGPNDAEAPEEDSQRARVLAAAATSASRTGPAHGGSLILVASLVDKAPNLGGLARTAEVFHADKLVLPSLAVTSARDFQGVSLEAERWLPLEAVPEAALVPWLRAHRAAGYALIGVEQTSESVSLTAFEFPARTVLVLGKEMAGIPADIIALLDACVEIPQLGVLRSLNVHVSGAIGLYEYVRQRLGAGRGGGKRAGGLEG